MNENQNLNTNSNENIVSENNISPISEVKIENEINNSEININKTKELQIQPTEIKPSNEQPKNSKKSTILLILLFVFLFAYVMAMPYINNFIQKLKFDKEMQKIQEEIKDEEEVTKPVKTPEETLKELICTSPQNIVGKYIFIETQKFNYNSENKVLSSALTSHYTFSLIDDSYNTLKTQCDENSLKYLTHEGYTTSCSYDESNIEISYEFDLETFTPIIDGETNIKANATYKQDINTIKNDLTSKGYTCQ